MRSKPACRGTSLMELIVVVAIASIVMLVAYAIYSQTMETSLRLEGRNELLLMTQRPTNILQLAVLHSRTIFSDGTIGQAYYNRIAGCQTCAPPILPQVPADWAPIANTMLPLIDTGETQITPDEDPPAPRRTGNCLLIARQLPPVFVNYDHDNNNATAAVPFPIDRYRFELYYLRRDPVRKFISTAKAVDIVRFRSVMFADYFQLNPLIGAAGTFVAAQKSQICAGLVAQGIDRAWDPTPGTAIASAFFTITTGGVNPGGMTPIANPTLNIDPGSAGRPSIDTFNKPGIGLSSLLRQMRGGSIAGKINYSVGFRRSASDEFPIVHSIPRYAKYDITKVDFPSGFEVKSVGVGPTQRTIIRLLLMANYGGGQGSPKKKSEVTTRARGWDSEEGYVLAASRQTM